MNDVLGYVYLLSKKDGNKDKETLGVYANYDKGFSVFSEIAEELFDKAGYENTGFETKEELIDFVGGCNSNKLFALYTNYKVLLRVAKIELTLCAYALLRE